MKKENANKVRPSQERLLMDDAGKIGASMVQISFTAIKLFTQMVKVAFRASKLIVDHTLKATRRHDTQQPGKL